MEQERVGTARSLKLHGYVRNGAIISSLIVECKSDYIDYRADRDARFKIVPATGEYHDLMLGFARKFDVALFDFDILETERGMAFLEINFSPAPVYFERIAEPEMRFSRTVLEDFLT
jgi:hypothetical protein